MTTEVTAIGMPSIQVALNNVKSAIGAVGKTERNTGQNFQYRGVDNVINAAAPALNREGVIVIPDVESYEYSTIESGAKRTPMGHVIVRVAYHFYGPAGDCLTARVLAESFDSSDKGAAKAMSVAYRIVLLQVLNLPTCDPDPDSEYIERSAGSAETPRYRNMPKTSEIAKTPENPNWAELVYAANSVNDLRATWKAAGAAGALNDMAANAAGEKVTVQQLLYARHEELGSLKSADDPA
jgi:ERF superfamily protein